MRRFSLHFTIVLAFAVSAWAQQQAAPAQHTEKHPHSKNANHPVTGCLSGPNDEGAYILTSAHHKFEVGGNDDLKNHVGHKVQLSGKWATGAEIGEQAKSEQGAKEEKGERHLQVTDIKMISDTCHATAASHGKKPKKSAPAKPTT